MDTGLHRLPALFDQLGLPSDPEGIRDFIARHRPLESTVRLHEAPWWSRAQADFLRESIEQDAEWAEAADELDALLRYSEIA